MAAKKPTFGRIAVDHLRSAYMAGSFDGNGQPNRAELVAYLSSTLAGFKQSKHGNAVGDWDRQARLENAEFNKLSVPNPVYANGYRRIAVATPAQRQAGRKTRRKDTRTRSLNDGIEARSDAAQVDATPNEIAIASMYDAIAKVLDAVQVLSDPSTP